MVHWQGLARLAGGLRRMKLSAAEDFFEAEHLEAADFVQGAAQSLTLQLG